MEPFLDGEDHASIRMSARETNTLWGESIIILRWTAYTGGNNNGVSPTRNNIQVPVRARVFQANDKDVLDQGGFVMLGDIGTETLIDIIQFSNKPNANTQADKLLFEGQTYLLVGKPKRIRVGGGRVRTRAFWRLVKS